jgi:hypothetical protein
MELVRGRTLGSGSSSRGSPLVVIALSGAAKLSDMIALAASEVERPQPGADE